MVLGLRVVPGNLLVRIAGAEMGFGKVCRYIFSSEDQPRLVWRRLLRFVVSLALRTGINSLAVRQLDQA